MNYKVPTSKVNPETFPPAVDFLAFKSEIKFENPGFHGQD